MTEKKSYNGEGGPIIQIERPFRISIYNHGDGIFEIFMPETVFVQEWHAIELRIEEIRTVAEAFTRLLEKLGG